MNPTDTKTSKKVEPIQLVPRDLARFYLNDGVIVESTKYSFAQFGLWVQGVVVVGSNNPERGDRIMAVSSRNNGVLLMFIPYTSLAYSDFDYSELSPSPQG